MPHAYLCTTYTESQSGINISPYFSLHDLLDKLVVLSARVLSLNKAYKWSTSSFTPMGSAHTHVSDIMGNICTPQNYCKAALAVVRAGAEKQAAPGGPPRE